MNSITLNSISGKTYSSKSSKTSKVSSKNEWKLDDSLKEKITQLAQEDAKNEEYMGNEYSALERKEVAKVSPDRKAAIAKATAMMNRGQHTQSGTKLQQEDDFWDKWLSKLLGLPYQGKFETSSSGTSAHLYDENGDEFASYTPANGWNVQYFTRKEHEVSDSMTLTYYDAYQEARRVIKSEKNIQTSNTTKINNTYINASNKQIDIKV